MVALLCVNNGMVKREVSSLNEVIIADMSLKCEMCMNVLLKLLILMAINTLMQSMVVRFNVKENI